MRKQIHMFNIEQYYVFFFLQRKTFNMGGLLTLSVGKSIKIVVGSAVAGRQALEKELRLPYYPQTQCRVGGN